MFISNIHQTNNYSAYHPIFGTTSKFHTIKKMQLQPAELEKISGISENLKKVLTFFDSLNGILQKKFKALYPGLVGGEKIKGFLFDSILEEKGKRLQITRLNTREDSSELLTFGLLDSDNKNILRYKIDKDGNAFVMKEKNNYEPVDTESLHKWNLDTFAEEMNYLNLYAENFKEVGRKIDGIKSTDEMHNILEQINSINNSKGFKDEAEQLIEAYAEIINEFNKNSWKDAFEMKQKYFGNLSQSRSKSLFFKSPDNSKIYSYTPANSSADNRIFKLMICDTNSKAEDGFLFFSDGKVARITPEALNIEFIRGRKMNYISDDDAEQLQLSKILDTINNGLKNFKAFIIEQRAEKAKNTRPYHKRIPDTCQSSKQSVKKENIKSSESVKLTPNTKVTKRIHSKKEVKKSIKPTLQHPPKENAKPQISQISPVIEKTTPVLSIQKKSSLEEISLTAISEKLNELFDTPIEERSSHLIHEKLSNGRIFSGRVALTTSDGAYVIVSRIKSPRYVDFMYYSIKVTKDGNSYIMNLDPEMGLILESTPEGKVIIDKRQRVKHLSKKEFLEQNPQAENLTKYLNELFEYRTDGEKKVINSKLKMRGITAKEREKEVLKALGMAPELSLDLLLKL